MQKNIGTQEAYMRIGAGVVLLLLALFITENPTIRIILAVLAAILAGTAFLRTCPINTFLKRNTYTEEATASEPINETIMEAEVTSEEPASMDPLAEEKPMGGSMPMDTEPETEGTLEEVKV